MKRHLIRLSSFLPTIRLAVREGWEQNVGKYIGGYLEDEGTTVTKGTFIYHYYRFLIEETNVTHAELARTEDGQVIYEPVPILLGQSYSVKLQNKAHGLMQSYIKRGGYVGAWFRIEYRGMGKTQEGPNKGAPMHDFDIQFDPASLTTLPSPEAIPALPDPEDADSVEEPV